MPSFIDRVNTAYKPPVAHVQANINKATGLIEYVPVLPPDADTRKAHKSTGQKWYSYDAGQLFSGNGGTVDRQLARNVWGANLAYQTVPEVKAALDVIAEEAAVVPMVIKDKQGNIIARSDENPDESALLTAILDSQIYTGDPLISLIAYDLKMVGMAFVQIIRNDFGFTKGLRRLNPAGIQIDCPRGYIEGYQYSAPSGEYKYLPPSDVIRLRDFNPADDIYGYGTTLNIMGKANAVLNFDRMKVAYYRNGGQPGVIVSFKDVVDFDEAKKLAEFWRNTYRGVDEWFKTQISHIPLDIGSHEPIDISKPLEVTIQDGKAILKGYRVAPEMIGDTTDNPYQFSPEKRFAFMQTVEQPITNKIAWAFNRQVTPVMEREGYQLFFDYDAFTVVTETEKAAQDMLHQDWQNGRITFNEYRQGNNYDPVEGGDFYMLPSGKVVVPVNVIGGKPVLPDVQQLVTQASQPAPLPALPSGDPVAQDAPQSGIPQAGDVITVQSKAIDTPRSAYAYTPFWNNDDPLSNDLRKWQTVAMKRYKGGNVADAGKFESDVLPAILQSSIRGALQAVSTPDQIYTIFDDAVRYLAHA